MEPGHDGNSSLAENFHIFEDVEVGRVQTSSSCMKRNPPVPENNSGPLFFRYTQDSLIPK